MEGNNGVSGGGGGGGGRGMLPLPAGMGSGMLGLEMSLHHPHPQQQPQQHLSPFPTAAQQQQQPVFGGAGGGGGGHAEANRISQSVVLGRLYPSPSSPSPWHRMKWTDSMVRLLIMIVYCVGDDAITSSTDQQAGDHHQQQHRQVPANLTAAGGFGSVKGKKVATAISASPSTSPSAGLLLQKKGKWKSVSRALMDKGFYVSPQQCEDKFNDLNKRYKRLNEILGKGTACRVVENQALLDTLNHVSPKAKDEARKLLNSKHLFFREMCAYHNSTSIGTMGATVGSSGGVSGGATMCASHPQPLHSLSPSQSQSQHQHHQQLLHQQLCLNHPSDSSSISMGFHGRPSFFGRGGHSNDNILGGVHEEEDEEKDQHDHDNNTDDYETGDNDDDDEVEGEEEEEDYEDEEEDDDTEKKKGSSSKQLQQARGTSLSASPPLSLTMSSSSPPVPIEQLRIDLMGSLTSVGGEQQQRQWLKRKAAELEEQQVGYRCRALKLERQRFKWLRFSSNKEQEMEKMRLSNKRLCLENDRMLLLLRQKEQELINHQYQ